jgi:glycosyltransferase involved in cell wall biosynthesis
MKILCVIDTLSSGGAQKQIVQLACGLQEKGHSVDLFVYHTDKKFYLQQLEAANVVVHSVNKPTEGVVAVFLALVRLMRQKQFDAAVGFLMGPCGLLALAGLFAPRSTRIVLGERSAERKNWTWSKKNFLRALHVFADDIVTNSVTQAQWLGRRWWLKRKKIHVVYNGYRIDAMQGTPKSDNKQPEHRLLILARVTASKNGVRLTQALRLFQQKHGYVPEVIWAGRQEGDADSLRDRAEIEAILANNLPLAQRWHWLGERSDVSALLQECDGLLHVSLYEGLPNAVCEAMIAARPVIASNVCDHPILLTEGERGFLCDPFSPESICAAIERFVAQDASARAAMGARARAYAEAHLGMDRMVLAYEKIFQGQGPELNGDSTCAE